MSGGRRKFAPHEAGPTAEAVEGPSNRSFGLIVGGVMLAIAALSFFAGGHSGWPARIFAAFGAPLVVLALAAPGVLAIPNKLWMKLGLLLGLVMTPIVMGLLYALTFVPIGLLMRLRGHDPLRRAKKPPSESYWIVREPPGPDPKTMPNQF
ncbi:MAG: hypothetical protein HXY21_08535 [Parvularculaceae bacterium]|nr:hypothetical protein [Parvularculaceae bacterium]